MSHYGGDSGPESISDAPTAKQLSRIETLCEHLGYDCHMMMPDDYDEAVETIERLEDEAGWDDLDG